MNKILTENIKSILKLTNNNELRITDEHIYEIDEDNKIIKSLSIKDSKNKLYCSYSFNNTNGEGVFYIKDHIIRAKNIETSNFLNFINLFKNFGNLK